MRERARACGGSVTAGPAPAGWVVRATLPVVLPVARPR
jgi:signal transduction histidine kinase